MSLRKTAGTGTLLYVVYVHIRHPVFMFAKQTFTGTCTYTVRTVYTSSSQWPSAYYLYRYVYCTYNLLYVRLLYVQYIPVAVNCKANYRYWYVYCAYSLPVAASGRYRYWYIYCTYSIIDWYVAAAKRNNSKTANYFLYYRF